MANPLLQQARQRKMIYFGAIVALFTLSLLHREFIVNRQAYALQLREDSRGEVELTSSAVRLVLTGSRGIAVTMLWYNAMDMQKRNEWHELELIVKSITKLQPYFITPWLFQSWNISFNVAVECDRPRDKYYYISRGLELLAEGERRNRGVEEVGPAGTSRVTFPGNPEMRHYMGFFYQLKIGSSDERLTMRTLLELSCIDPIERNPNRFWQSGRKDVDLVEFNKFCQQYPRTVRRLREQLLYEDPKRIVQFLQEHQDIPSRFKKAGERADKSELKPWPEKKDLSPFDREFQFPILPPHEGNWPDPSNPDLTDETVDVFLMCRTWYDFAQKPLPPPDANPRWQMPDYDKQKYRIPKQMVTQLFRQYPPRAQVYIAETLDSEGWFDSEGWDIPVWFEKMPGRQGDVDRVGTDRKYHSQLAWERAFEAYKEYGRENGMYISPEETARLEKLARICREEIPLREDELPQVVPAEWRTGEKGKSLEAHYRLRNNRYFRRLTNYAAFFDQAEGERDPVTVAARKALFVAERKRKGGAPSELMLRYYDKAWTLYVQACLRHPHFAQVTSMQEDLYEIHQRYLQAAQVVHSELFKKRAVTAAKIGFSPYSFEAGALSFHTAETIAPALAFWPPSDWRSALAAQAFTGQYMLDDAGTLSAKLANWPLPSWREALVRDFVVRNKEREDPQMPKVLPIRKRWGPLDAVEYYDGPHAKEVKEALLLFTIGHGLPMNAVTAIPYPGIEYFYLCRRTPFIPETFAPNWKPIITAESRRVTAGRLGLPN